MGLLLKVARTIVGRDIARSFDSAAPRLQLAIIVAQYAEVLRGSRWADRAGTDLADLAYDARVLDRLAREDGEVREFIRLVERTPGLEGRGDRDRRDPDRYR